MTSVILILLNAVALIVAASKDISSDIEVYTFQNFPKNKIALHMPCEESNMFATKCMCHIKCTDNNCLNAKKICIKYRESKGCRFMLIRGNQKKIATLKRTPTEFEMTRFNVSMYPRSFESFNTPEWKLLKDRSKLLSTTRTTLNGLMDMSGAKGRELLNKIFYPEKPAGTFCGKKYSSNVFTKVAVQSEKSNFLNRGISLVALSYHAPMTLVNSMRTWKESGLLDMVHEKIIILNDPIPEEYAIALEFGFKIIEPKDVPGGKMSKHNVFTIGAAFYYALEAIESEYLLFLENDFKMDVELSRSEIAEELLGATGMLESGIEIVRLNSRKYKGCGTFKDCDHHGINMHSQSPDDTKRNWFAFYCRDKPETESHVSDCLDSPSYRCFSSWDTNWTLNAVLVKKTTMLSTKYPVSPVEFKSIAQIGLNQWEKQDGFESVMAFSLPWQKWKVPICISYQGLFIHEEIETAT